MVIAHKISLIYEDIVKIFKWPCSLMNSPRRLISQPQSSVAIGRCAQVAATSYRSAKHHLSDHSYPSQMPTISSKYYKPKLHTSPTYSKMRNYTILWNIVLCLFILGTDDGDTTGLLLQTATRYPPTTSPKDTQLPIMKQFYEQPTTIQPSSEVDIHRYVNQPPPTTRHWDVPLPALLEQINNARKQMAKSTTNPEGNISMKIWPQNTTSGRYKFPANNFILFIKNIWIRVTLVFFKFLNDLFKYIT